MISLPQVHQAPPGEGCGTCTACCIIPMHPDLGKPLYARCYHLANKGCGIYEQRPDRCRTYRCAWHLGLLGDRVDRRPDHSGVLLQFDAVSGAWTLSVYELQRGAAFSDRARYLRDIVLKNKNVRHLKFTNPPVRIVPYGADIAADFPVSPRYNYVTPVQTGRYVTAPGELRYVGPQREILDPTP